MKEDLCMAQSVNTRELILEILLQITRDGEYSHIALKNALDQIGRAHV